MGKVVKGSVKDRGDTLISIQDIMDFIESEIPEDEWDCTVVSACIGDGVVAYPSKMFLEDELVLDTRKEK